MNWREHLKYCKLYQEFINWYKAQVDIFTFYSLTDTEAANIDNYLRCFHGVTTNEKLFEVAKKTYLGVKTTEAIADIYDRPHKKSKQIVAYPLDFPVVSKENWICVYCEDPASTVDHLIPISKGGTNDKHNLAHCCQDCNTLKGSFTLTEFAILLDRLIIQSNEMGNTEIVGAYGLMLLNVNKLLVYEEKYINTMYKASKPTKRRSVTKRSLKSPLNMSEIKLGVSKKPKKKLSTRAEIQKARGAIEKIERPKLIIGKRLFTPAPKINVLNPTYLDIAIAESRKHGFKTLWEYELANPETWQHRIA